MSNYGKLPTQAGRRQNAFTNSRRSSSLSSEIITVRSGFKKASIARVHEDLLRRRSKAFSKRIDDARKEDEKNVTITINLSDTAKHRWCVWLYGQGLWSRSDDPDFVLMDVGAIYAFSAQEGDHECANVCLDVIREILVDEHSTVTIHLNTLLDFLDQSQEAFQMLIDLLVYGPFASSGFTRG
jgi:hypothetical protein